MVFERPMLPEHMPLGRRQTGACVIPMDDNTGDAMLHCDAS